MLRRSPPPCRGASGRRSPGTRRRTRRCGPSHSGDSYGSPQASTMSGPPDRMGQAHHVGPVARRSPPRSSRVGGGRPPTGRGSAHRPCRPVTPLISCRMRSAWWWYRCSPVSAARRYSAIAAIELADGVALSAMSFWRTTSASASSAVVYSPPFSGSQNQSSIVSAVRTASSIHRACPVASASRVNASTRAAWSAASAACRACGSPSACQLRIQRPFGRPQFADQELGVGDRRVEPVLPTERRPGLGQDGQEERVPFGERPCRRARGAGASDRGRRTAAAGHARCAADGPAPRALRGDWGSTGLAVPVDDEVALVGDAEPRECLVDLGRPGAVASAARASSGVHVWNSPSTP